MDIVFSNPCFLGDIICTLPPAEVWKKRGARVTLICEDIYGTKEPMSILEKDPNIDVIHQLPFNTIPRGMDQPAGFVTPWVEEFLGRKVDKVFDLHKTITGSNGKNWFELSELPWNEFNKLRFYPTKDDYDSVSDFIGYVGISHRLPDKEKIMRYLDVIHQPYVVLHESLGFNLMQVYCMIDRLKLLITPCCIHNTLCWATETPNILGWTGSVRDFMTFDMQNRRTTTVRPYDVNKILEILERT